MTTPKVSCTTKTSVPITGLTACVQIAAAPGFDGQAPEKLSELCSLPRKGHSRGSNGPALALFQPRQSLLQGSALALLPPSCQTGAGLGMDCRGGGQSPTVLARLGRTGTFWSLLPACSGAVHTLHGIPLGCFTSVLFPVKAETNSKCKPPRV